jgi:hypothetical protein
MTQPAEKRDVGGGSTTAVQARPKLESLRWANPAAEVDPPIGVTELLQAFQFLASDADRDDATRNNLKWDDPTPASMQVIRSGALTITKTGTKLIAGAGGLSAAIAAGTAAIAGPLKDLGPLVTSTLIGSAALILSFASIAIALFVKGDLEARGVATAARHEGRAAVVAAFLTATASMPSRSSGAVASGSMGRDALAALAAFPGRVEITSVGDSSWRVVKGVQRQGFSHPLKYLVEGDALEESEITGLRLASAPSVVPGMGRDALAALAAFPGRVEVTSVDDSSWRVVKGVQRQEVGHPLKYLVEGDALQESEITGLRVRPAG